MKQFLFFITFMLLLILSACTYSLDDFYENKVDKNVSPPKLAMLTLDFQQDTVFIYNYPNLSFNLLSDNQAILGGKLILDGREIETVNAVDGQLKFQYLYIPDGNHSLELQTYTHSGTGSIADKLEGESWAFTKKWVLVVDRDISNNLRYEVKDGFLHFNYKKYRLNDFVSYVLKRGGMNPPVIAETKLENVVDSSYVGEGSEYRIYVKLTDGSLLPWGYIVLHYELPEVHLGVRSNTDYYMWWHRNRFYKALKGYKFILSDHVFATSDNEADTTVNLPNVRFRDNISFSLEYVPDSRNLYYSSGSFQRYYDDYAALKYNTTDGYFFTTKQTGADEISWIYNDTIYKYSLTNLNYTSKKRILEGYITYGTTSPHADYFFGNYTPTSNNHRYFGKNMKTGKISYFDSFSNYSGGISQSLPVSDVGTTVIMNLQNETGYDLENNSLLYINSHNNKTSTSMKISSDGKYYMYNSDSLYVYTPRQGTSGTQKVLAIGNYSTTNFYQFNTENPNQMVITNGINLTVYQCLPFTVLLNVSLSQGEEILFIDYYKNEILCGNTNVYRIRSLITGELIYELPISYTPHWYDHNYLVNHTLITSYGYYIKLNY